MKELVSLDSSFTGQYAPEFVSPGAGATDHNLLAGRSTADAHPASAITNTPAGNVAATTVQAAINELDSEKVPLVSGSAVFSEASGIGIKVDLDTPVFPWRDIIGLQNEDLSGVNSPVLAAFRGGLVRTYAYTTNDKMDVKFHIPHDYLAGSDIFIHVHWMHNGTAITGNFTGSLAHTYAKGHNQAIFPAEKTVTVTYATVNIATTPQYIQRIDEVQLSSSGGSATLMDSAVLEPDGVVLANFTLTALPTITGGTTNRVFIPFIDIHYQSTGIGTKQKAPAFYV